MLLLTQPVISSILLFGGNFSCCGMRQWCCSALCPFIAAHVNKHLDHLGRDAVKSTQFESGF